MCLISMSVAHLQHEFSRNLDNPPMDKSKADCTSMQRPCMILMVTKNLQILLKKCSLNPSNSQIFHLFFQWHFSFLPRKMFNLLPLP